MNRLMTVFAILTCVIFAACQPRVLGVASGFVRDNVIEVAGIKRFYDLYLPNDLPKTPRPLVMLFHGNGGSAAQLMGLDGKPAPFKIWQEIAEREKLILVIPQGTVADNGKQGWNDCRADATTNPSTNDVAFISTLLEVIAAKYPVDKQRVYASGISNGGHMVLRLALEIPNSIAAVAVVAASMPATSECSPIKQPVSVLFMNGTKDPIAPFAGGEMGLGSSKGERGSIVSTAAAVQYWVSQNQTKTTPETKTIDFDPNDGGFVLRSEYCCAQNQTSVVLYAVDGGGHTEPSLVERYGAFYKLIVGAQSSDLEMANEVWEFFKTKSKTP
jgi:polyhydroxybutyrate depolymerase